LLSLDLRDECKLRLTEKSLLRRIFGLKREEIIGKLKKIHEKLHDEHSLCAIIRVIKSVRMGWAGLVARMGEMRSACRILVGKYNGQSNWDSWVCMEDYFETTLTGTDAG
jgi:hypothetical protein